MIKIITDSTAYISEEFAKANDIKIVRLHTIIGDEDFIEGFPGSFEKVYKKIDEKVFFPKTSQPACGDFVDAFNEVVDNGDEAIVLILSSTLSGTINGATVAKGLCSCPDKISIVDSGTTGHNMWGIVC
ncbi:MAG: DegV family protein, partial [Clostridia bacterium]